MASPSGAPWRRRFAILWLGQSVSQLGSAMTGFALGVWVYQRSGSVTQFALTLLSNTLPAVLGAAWAGGLTERHDRRKIMLAADSVAGVCTAALMVLLSSGGLQLWHIYLANACNALARTCQWPAYAASVPRLVPAEKLARASGLLQLSQGMAQLAAPLLGGLLLARYPLATVFLADLASFGVAVLTLAMVRFPDASQAAASPAQERNSAAAWRALAQRPGVLALTGLVVLGNFTAGSVEVLVTPLVLSFSSTVELGTLMTIGGLGMIAGSVGLSLWGATGRLVLPLLLAEAVAGAALILAGVRPSFAVLAGAALLFFGATPIGTGCHHALLQRELEPHWHGRVFALLGATASAALMAGYALAGPLADHVFEPLMAPAGALATSAGALLGTGDGRGIGLLFVVMGLLSLGATLATWLRPAVRQLDGGRKPKPPKQPPAAAPST